MTTRVVWWVRFGAVLRFEVRAQWRDPLTTLYVLVFGLLSLGYASSDAVELVTNRGAVPRTASWALMLAFGGLTAFGQVITTMITTTAMLRDEAQRTRALVATSGIAPVTWFTARVGAALLIMLAVYAAIPLGVCLGTALRSGALLDAVAGATRAYLVMTVPTMITVTLLLASAALYTQRVLGVLALALLLVGVWQAALSLAGSEHMGVVAGLLDPFGNAPVLVVTRAWTEGERMVRLVPVDGLVLANRALWLVLSLTVAASVLRYRGHRAFSPTAPSGDGGRDVRTSTVLARATSALASARHFTAGWMQQDGGWRIVSVLALLNAFFNAATRPLSSVEGAVPGAGSPFTATLLLASEHSRLFLILLATVYAGELVWRERDVRVQQLIDTMPAPRGTVIWGRISGLFVAQRAIVVPIAMMTLCVAAVRSSSGAFEQLTLWMAWSVFVLWLPFAQLTALSLAVHVLLDHKVLAHLLLITGWVLAVVLDGQGVAMWWVRFAEAAPLVREGDVNWPQLVTRAAYWSGVSGVLLAVSWWRWPRVRG